MSDPTRTKQSTAWATVCRRLKHARHNLIIHPLAGVCWLFGLQSWGDYLHENW